MAKILIVDDEPTVAAALRRIFVETHEVTLAHEGLQAWQLLNDGAHFDAIFCDILMPKLTGVELYERLRVQHPKLAAKIIFLVGGGYSTDICNVLDQAPNLKVSKPFHVSSVQAALTELLEAHNPSN